MDSFLKTIQNNEEGREKFVSEVYFGRLLIHSDAAIPEVLVLSSKKRKDAFVELFNDLFAERDVQAKGEFFYTDEEIEADQKAAETLVNEVGLAIDRHPKLEHDPLVELTSPDLEHDRALVIGECPQQHREGHFLELALALT